MLQISVDNLGFVTVTANERDHIINFLRKLADISAIVDIGYEIVLRNIPESDNAGHYEVILGPSPGDDFINEFSSIH